MEITKKISNLKIPVHLAIIMDGNGRWAKKRGLNRTEGHKKGFDALIENCKFIRKIGIKMLSVYAFSTENWNRPKEEVDCLLDLFAQGFDKLEKEYKDEQVKVIVSGELSKFPDNLRNKMTDLVLKTKDKEGFILNFCLNYGGRAEILRAVNNIIQDARTNIDEKTFSDYLYTAGYPDPDFVIRTSGEQRLSGFLPWQTVYSEFYFPKKFWPAFGEKDLIKCLKIYSKRDRRFGRVVSEN